MSVLLANTTATVLRRQEGALDAHGERTRTGFGGPLTMYPARVREREGGGWALGLDPALWPVREGDVVLDGEGRSYVVESSALLQNSWADDVDWIRVAGLIRNADGSIPVGTWYVGRVGSGPVPEEPEPVAGLFTGHGPPPDGLVGQIGDEYLDLDTGTMYQLTED